MASSYSTNLKIELQATGENSGTWGTITNTNLGTALEQAVVGYGNPSYPTDANLTLTYTDTNAAQAARALVLNVTSAVSLTATRELVVPTIQKQYIVQNNTTGSQSITVKTSGGTGITVTSGRKAHLYVNGTDVIFMDDFVDINGGAIDGTTIGASSAAAGTFTTATATTGNITTVNATTVDATNIEVTNLKAKDGTAAGSIADSTGVVTLASSVLTTTDINGGTIDGTTIGGSSAAAGTFTTLTASSIATFAAGSAAAPSITTTGDTNTGIFFPAADTIAFTEGGVEAARIDSSGNLLIGATANPGTLNKSIVVDSGASTLAGIILQNDSTGRTSSDGSVLLIRSSQLELINQENAALLFSTNNTERARIDSSGNLGIGTTPSAWRSGARALQLGANGYVALFEQGNGAADFTFAAYESAANTFAYRTTGDAPTLYSQVGGTHTWSNAVAGTANATFSFTERMRLDSSGNLGLGVTPSAWGAPFGSGVLEISGGYFAGTSSSNVIRLSLNNYYNGSNYIYKTSAEAAAYAQSGGAHQWSSAASGTAGNTISFTQAMTLDASGYLLLNTTTSNSFAGFSQFILGAGASGSIINFQESGASKFHIRGGTGASPQLVIESRSGTNGILVFGTNETERARITAAGLFGIGTTSPTAKLQVEGLGRFNANNGLGTITASVATNLTATSNVLENSTLSNSIILISVSGSDGLDSGFNGFFLLNLNKNFSNYVVTVISSGLPHNGSGYGFTFTLDASNLKVTPDKTTGFSYNYVVISGASTA